MPTWSQDSAVAELGALVGEIPALAEVRRFSSQHTRWTVRTLTFLEQVFGQASRYYLSFAHLKWAESGPMILGGPGDPEGVWRPQAAIERRHQEAYLRQLEMAHGLLLAALDDLQREGLDSVYQGKDTGPQSSALLRILSIIEHKLRKVIRDKPSSEREIQDALENLLVGADIPYSREKDSVEYSSKTYSPDFTLPRLDLTVEVKFCSRPDREKELIAEINDDILAYKTKFGNLLFAVYDLGFIRDVDLFREALESHDGVVVRVVKH